MNESLVHIKGSLEKFNLGKIKVSEKTLEIMERRNNHVNFAV